MHTALGIIVAKFRESGICLVVLFFKAMPLHTMKSS